MPRVVDHPLTVDGETVHVTATSLGNPHCAVFLDAPADDALLYRLGPLLERHPFFPRSTNVEFVTVASRSELRVRFWERGVGYTRASGTGSASAAVAAIVKGVADRRLRMVCDGGTLEVEWPEGGTVRQTRRRGDPLRRRVAGRAPVTISPPPRGLRILMGLAVAFALAQAGYSAWDQGWAIDERVHLEWSRRLLATGEDERESRPRFDSKTPIVIPNVLAMKAAQAAGATLGGPEVRGSPAHRPLPGRPAPGHLPPGPRALRPDRGLSGHAGQCARSQPGRQRQHRHRRRRPTPSASCSPPAPRWLSCKSRPADERSPRAGPGFRLHRQVLRRVASARSGLASAPRPLAAEGAHVTPCALDRCRRRGRCGFRCALRGVPLRRRCAVPLGGLPLASRPLGLLARLAPGLRLPLPAAFLTGIDHSIVRDGGVWPVYVLGVFHPRPVWYYFPFHWVLKTPVGLLLFEILGFSLLLRSGILRRSGGARFVAAILVMHLAFFSFLFRTQIGYRFILMCVPLGYVLAAGGLTDLLGARRLRMAAAAAVAVAFLENAMYWGNPFAFTSAAVWPKRSAWRLMADSSLDYGQDRERIARWLAGTDSALNPVHIVPGHDTINLNVFVGLPDPERYRWLREHVSSRRSHRLHASLLAHRRRNLQPLHGRGAPPPRHRRRRRAVRLGRGPRALPRRVLHSPRADRGPEHRPPLRRLRVRAQDDRLRASLPREAATSASVPTGTRRPDRSARRGTSRTASPPGIAWSLDSTRCAWTRCRRRERPASLALHVGQAWSRTDLQPRVHQEKARLSARVGLNTGCLDAEFSGDLFKDLGRIGNVAKSSNTALQGRIEVL